MDDAAGAGGQASGEGFSSSFVGVDQDAVVGGEDDVELPIRIDVGDDVVCILNRVEGFGGPGDTRLGPIVRPADRALGERGLHPWHGLEGDGLEPFRSRDELRGFSRVRDEASVAVQVDERGFRAPSALFFFCGGDFRLTGFFVRFFAMLAD